MKAKSKRSKDKSQAERVLDPKKGRYSDGHPLDKVHYLESKIILKGERSTSVDSFTEFAKLVRRAAENEGEFAFQCKFQRTDERHAVAMKRCERFFVALQNVAKDWIALGTTKTGAVYRLKGNPPQAHG